MLCPQCGNKPFAFAKWMRTLNPFRVQCHQCQAQLKAGTVAYIWLLCHVPIGFGIAVLVGLSSGSSGPTRSLFFLGGAAVLFFTAFVIPCFGFKTYWFRVIR